MKSAVRFTSTPHKVIQNVEINYNETPNLLKALDITSVDISEDTPNSFENEDSCRKKLAGRTPHGKIINGLLTASESNLNTKKLFDTSEFEYFEAAHEIDKENQVNVHMNRNQKAKVSTGKTQKKSFQTILLKATPTIGKAIDLRKTKLSSASRENSNIIEGSPQLSNNFHDRAHNTDPTKSQQAQLVSSSNQSEHSSPDSIFDYNQSVLVRKPNEQLLYQYINPVHGRPERSNASSHDQISVDRSTLNINVESHFASLIGAASPTSHSSSYEQELLTNALMMPVRTKEASRECEPFRLALNEPQNANPCFFDISMSKEKSPAPLATITSNLSSLATSWSGLKINETSENYPARLTANDFIPSNVDGVFLGKGPQTLKRRENERDSIREPIVGNINMDALSTKIHQTALCGPDNTVSTDTLQPWTFSHQVPIPAERKRIMASTGSIKTVERSNEALIRTGPEFEHRQTLHSKTMPHNPISTCDVSVQCSNVGMVSLWAELPGNPTTYLQDDSNIFAKCKPVQNRFDVDGCFGDKPPMVLYSPMFTSLMKQKEKRMLTHRSDVGDWRDDSQSSLGLDQLIAMNDTTVQSYRGKSFHENEVRMPIVATASRSYQSSVHHYLRSVSANRSDSKKLSHLSSGARRVSGYPPELKLSHTIGFGEESSLQSNCFTSMDLHLSDNHNLSLQPTNHSKWANETLATDRAVHISDCLSDEEWSIPDQSHVNNQTGRILAEKPLMHHKSDKFSHLQKFSKSNSTIPSEIRSNTKMNSLPTESLLNSSMDDNVQFSISLPNASHYHASRDTDHQVTTSDDSQCDDTNMTNGAETTMTLDEDQTLQSILFSPSGAKLKKAPRFSIQTIKRDASAGSVNIKEIGFKTFCSDFTELPLSISNRQNKPIKLKAYAFQIRFEGADKMDAPNVDENCFEVSPSNVELQVGESVSLQVIFRPPTGRPGVYSGVLKVKSSKKSFLVLLRGEAETYSISPEQLVEPVKEEIEKIGLATDKLRQLRDVMLGQIQRMKGVGESSNDLHQKNKSNGLVIFPNSIELRMKGESDFTGLALEGQIVIDNSNCQIETEIRLESSRPFLKLAKTNFIVPSYQVENIRVMVDVNHPEWIRISNEVEAAITIFPSPSAVPDGSKNVGFIEIETKHASEPQPHRYTLDVVVAFSNFSTKGRSCFKNQSVLVEVIPNPNHANLSSQLVNYQNAGKSIQQCSVGSSTACRSGMFFRKQHIHFGSVSTGSLTRTKIELCNGTDNDIVVYLGDPNLPFVLLHNEIKLRSRSYARVPVRFLPIAKGDYNSVLIAQTIDGNHQSCIALSGTANQ